MDSVIRKVLFFESLSDFCLEFEKNLLEFKEIFLSVKILETKFRERTPFSTWEEFIFRILGEFSQKFRSDACHDSGRALWGFIKKHCWVRKLVS